MASSSGGGGIPILSAMKSGKLGEPSSIRDLGLAVLKIVSYMCLGVLLYTFQDLNKWPEIGSGESLTYDMPTDWSWDVIDCFYFTMVTITTVGYGDMPTLTQPMRIVTAFFGIVGVVQIASSLNVIADWFVERARRRFISKQRVVLLEAKRAGEMVRNQAPAAAPSAAASAAGTPNPSMRKGSKRDVRRNSRDLPNAESHMVVENMNSKADSPVTSENQLGAGLPSPPNSPPGEEDGGGAEGAKKLSQVVPMEGNDAALAELVKGEAQRRESVASGAPQVVHEKTGCEAFLHRNPRIKYASDMFNAFLPCIFFIVCCFVLGVVENVMYDCYDEELYPNHASIVDSGLCWTGIDSFYYSFITLSTIGYGDVTPHSKWGKLMAIFMIPFAIVSLTNFMGKMHDIKVSKKMGFDKTLKDRLEELHTVIEQDDNGVVSPEEYILFNLKQMGKIDDDTVNLLRDQFNALDADGSGELDATDIGLLQKACDIMAAGELGSPRSAAAAHSAAGSAPTATRAPGALGAAGLVAH